MRGVLAIAALGTGAALALGGCASRASLDPTAWSADEIVDYRLLTKDDFQASTSSRVWGNVAHGAEICTVIVPAEDHERTSAFRAVMNPRCSFWNRTVSPLATLGGLAGASVVPGLGTQQPDWYVLQHEQIHFAIMQAAALQLSQQVAGLPPERRTGAAIEEAYGLAVAKTDQLHEQFDAATSGSFDPPNLDVWVRALETEMRRLCGTQPRCWVRHQTPLGWGD